jgi:hypothetical protein
MPGTDRTELSKITQPETVMAKVNMNVTPAERRFVIRIAEDQYMDGDPTRATWTSSVCESPADKALLGSLVKKGLAHTNGEACGLTQYGLRVYTSALRNLAGGKFLGGQAHWVRVGLDGRITEVHTWVPRSLIGSTLQDAEAWYAAELEAFDEKHREAVRRGEFN